VLVPAVDRDGNDVAGIRPPEIEVPLATCTPWNFRAESIGAPEEMADFRGSELPFERTRVERLKKHDPRPSIEERYASREDYVERFTQAVRVLVAQHLLLDEDVPGLEAHAGELWDRIVGVPADTTTAGD